jgi:hypothetical protein
MYGRRGVAFAAVWALAGATGGLLFELLSSFNLALAVLLLGGCLGLPQSIALQSRLPRAWGWIVVTTIGVLGAWLVGALVAILLLALFGLATWLVQPLGQALLAGAIVLLVVVTFVGGSVTGLLQSSLVMESDAAIARWMPVSGFGAVAFWTVLIGLHLPFGGLADTISPLVHLGSGVAGGAAYGLTTAPALHGLLEAQTETWAARVASRGRGGQVGVVPASGTVENVFR